MKKSFMKLIVAAAAVICAVACEDEYADVRPGSYVDHSEIFTFPGDTVLISGTASNYSPIERITFAVSAWNVERVIDISGRGEKVFNWDWKLIVPDDAEFDQTLVISVICENGQSTVKEIPVKFIEDTTPPKILSPFPSQTEVTFDETASKGVWDLSLDVYDERKLGYAVVTIEDPSVSERFDFSRREGKIEMTEEFTTEGSYNVKIELYDAAGNKTEALTELVVMKPEAEDPIEDYPEMYLYCADEQESSYIFGYYRFMEKTGKYAYKAVIHALEDGAGFLFTPDTEDENCALFGASPKVSSKLLNKRGYVIPVEVEKAGYYEISIDIEKHSFSLTEKDVTGSYDGTLYLSGSGFSSFPDWGFYELEKNGYVYEAQVTTAGSYAGVRNICFAGPGWDPTFRSDKDGKEWEIAASGSCAEWTCEEEISVTVGFDTALPWGYIKKAN